MRQILGFAVFGGLVALIAASASDASTPRGSVVFAYTGSPPMFPEVFAEQPYVAHVVGGVIAGALIGSVLRLCGFVMTGPPHNGTARVVAAGLVGATVGVGLAVAAAFGGVIDDPGSAGILAVYAVCAVLAYVLSLAAVLAVLRLSDDGRTRQTVRTLAWVVPIGAVVATAAGVGAASLFDFATTEPTWVATCTVVVTVVGSTFAIGRAVALSRA